MLKLLRLLFIIFELNVLFGVYLPNLKNISFDSGKSNSFVLSQRFSKRGARPYDQVDTSSRESKMDLKNLAKNNTINSYTYSWSKWGKWSKCSRSCVGVQIKKRNCIGRTHSQKKALSFEFEPFKNGSSKGCVGLYKRFRICNDKECSSATDDQCSIYNNMLFNGKTYVWLPYLNGNNECELNCTPEGSKYFMTLNTSVVNGTPCNRPAVYFQKYYRGRAVCVEGICKAVHSSGAIRGDTTYDRTERCGSVLCEAVSKVFTRSKLPPGYFHITSIPRGVFNFSAVESETSTNFLAIKSDHVFILNGKNQQNVSGIYTYRENRFHYVNGEEKGTLEKVNANGFLPHSVDLLIFVRENNTSIKYKYFVPVSSNSFEDDEEKDLQWDELGVPLDYGFEHKDNANNLLKKASHTPEKMKKKMEWRLVGFGPCNKSCGGGYRAPIFRCTREIPTRYYSPRRCKHIEKPVFNELIFRCNNQECPGYWRIEKWDECFCNNGKGIRERVVKCVRTLATGAVMQVNETLCLDEKPDIKQQCDCFPQIPKRVSRHKLDFTYSKHHAFAHETESLIKVNGSFNKQTIFGNKNDRSGVWLMSEWNDCSPECGFGIQHRSIFCDRTYPFADRCDMIVTPDTSRLCISKQKCDEGNWFTSQWSECMGDCFSLFRKRQVICIQSGNVVNDNECSAGNKPEDRKNCTILEVSYCKAKWHYSEWSQCSRSCDGGTQRRFAKCLEIDEMENILRESGNCRYLEREPVHSTCNNFKCPETVIEYSNMVQNESELVCQDEFPNCKDINKERLCSLNYYQRSCCETCRL